MTSLQATFRGVDNFSPAEYERRHGKIRAAMAERGLDALLVTAPQHLAYVAGDPHGFMTAGVHLGLSPLVMLPGSSSFLVRKFEAQSAEADSPIDRIVGYSSDVEDPRDPVDVLADHLLELDLAGARIGYEGDLWGLTAADLEGLRRRLRGAELVEATDVVGRCVTVKSAEELELMRRVARVSVAGVEAFLEATEVGASEADVASAVWRALIHGGSEFPYYMPYVLSGERTWLSHGAWALRRIEAGDPVFTEQSASLLHYHSPLARTVIVGENPEAEELYEAARAAQDAAIAKMRVGATNGDVDDACRNALREGGRDGWLKHRVGYAVGIDWVGRKALSLQPEGDVPLEPGMTFHVVCLLSDPGRFGVFVSDTVAVSEGEPEILSGFSRELVKK
jgi:Xaa-Pro dipeptidase